MSDTHLTVVEVIQDRGVVRGIGLKIGSNSLVDTIFIQKIRPVVVRRGNIPGRKGSRPTNNV